MFLWKNPSFVKFFRQKVLTGEGGSRIVRLLAATQTKQREAAPLFNRMNNR